MLPPHLSSSSSSSSPATKFSRLLSVILLTQLALTFIVPILCENQNPLGAPQKRQPTIHSTPSLFARILQHPPNATSHGSIVSSSSNNATTKEFNAEADRSKRENELDTDGEDDADEEDEEDDEDLSEEEEDEDEEVVQVDSKTIESLQEGGVKQETVGSKTLTDSSGNKLELRDGADNRTSLVRVPINANKITNNRLTTKRDLGLLTLKAIILGPLIGLTIKAALIRGLLYALLAYGLHLFFPSLLGTLGLGTGLVGFARQLQPNYAQLLLPHLAQLQHSLPSSLTRMAQQYQQVFSPVVESIRAIPEGHCRYRAVCETASQLIRQSRSMSPTLQRISATLYTQFGSDYAKAWLDGVVQSDCAAKYAQCPVSPFSLVAGRLAQALGARDALPQLTGTEIGTGLGAGGGMPSAVTQPPKL